MSDCDLAADSPATEPRPEPRPPRASLRTWIGLLVLLGPVLLVSMDGSILFVAMPEVTVSLAPSTTQALWILDIYPFMVAPLLITTGNLGDRFGRRRLLTIGVAIFGIGSVMAALAPSSEVLIAARAILGIGGGTLLPTTLALIGAMFTNPKQQTLAIGMWTATFAAGFAIGPVAAGALLTQWWWGSVFLINVPVVVAFLLLAPFVIKEVPTSGAGRLDYASVASSIVGIFGVVYGLKNMAAHGFSVGVVGALGVGAAAGVFFVRRQRSLPNALLDTSLFRQPLFAMAVILAATSMFVFSGATYLASTYLQGTEQFSPLKAGLLGVPAAIVIAVFCLLAGRVSTRVGTERAVTAAFGLMAIGAAIFATTGAGGGTWGYVVGVSVAGVGIGLAFALASETAITAVPPERGGSAAALTETGFELGQAFGIALLGSVTALVFRNSGPELADTLPDTLGQAGITEADVAQANAAFSQGVLTAGVSTAIIAAGLTLLSALWLRAR